MSFIDLFKNFHREAIRQEFPTSARALYDALLYKFNEQYWTEEIGFSERDLSQMTGLSAATIHRAIKFLCDRGYIKTHRMKHGTAFKLLGDNVPAQNEADVKRERSSNEAVVKQERSSFENPNIRAREDLKTEDIQSSNIHSARTRENFDEEYWSRLWLENNGASVSFELLSYLQTLVESHGADFVEAMIRESAASYGGDFRISLKYFRACVDRKLKGGEKRENGSRVVQLYQRTDRPDRRAKGNLSATGSGNGGGTDQTPDYDWLDQELKKLSADGQLVR